MTIKTYSAWNYGHSIDDTNFYVDINEGVGELSGTLNIGDYSLGTFAVELERVLNAIGALDYTVALDRVGRQLTINSSGNFDLLLSTGTHVGTSIWNLAGFSQGSDLVGASSYTGASASGSQYLAQFWLQSFVDFQDNFQSSDASVSESANGVVEVVTFGGKEIMECNLTFVTDFDQGSGCETQLIVNNPNGVSDLRSFLRYATTKQLLEFVPDVVNDPNSITKCILEKTPESAQGVSFKIKELYRRNLPGYFETGIIQFRKVT